MNSCVPMLSFVLIIYVCVCMCVCGIIYVYVCGGIIYVCVYAYVCVGLLRGHESIGFPGARVAGCCEPPTMRGWNRTVLL